MVIALLSSAPLLLLDEPTAGCDPISRQQCWKLIRTGSRMRTVLVCTHYLSEADELCDRICVMAGGRMLIAGTSEFIKRRFGDGYTIRIGRYALMHSRGLNPRCDRERSSSSEDLIDALKPFVYKATVLNEAARELTIQAAHT